MKRIREKLYEGKNVLRQYQTMDGLGDVYEAISRGQCVCWGFRASCPQHGIKTSIYSTTHTREAYPWEIEEFNKKKRKND